MDPEPAEEPAREEWVFDLVPDPGYVAGMAAFGIDVLTAEVPPDPDAA